MNRFILFLSTFAIVTMVSICIVRPVAAEEPSVQHAAYELTTEHPEERKNDLSYSPQWPTPPDTGAMLLRLVFGTVVVLGLCVGSLWLGKPWLMKLHAAQTANSVIQIAGSVSLGQRAVLYLVKVGDAQLIAGTDVSGLKSLLALPASFKDVLDEPESSIEVSTLDVSRIANRIPSP